MSRELTMIDERRWSEEMRGVKRKRVERRGEERRSEKESIICSPQTISCTDNHEVD